MIPTSNFWANKNVLVTGHTGFKGSWLTLWLSRLGAKIHGISLPRCPNSSLFESLNFSPSLLYNHYGDIRDSAFLLHLVQSIRPDVVFHLAAQPLVRYSYIEPLETWSTNLLGSLHLLESLKFANKKCAVVMVTTDKVYHNLETNHQYIEDDRLGGLDPYSASKAAAELGISSWRHSFIGCNEDQNPHLMVATARAGNVIGGGDWSRDRIMPDVIRSLSTGNPITLRNPNSRRPWQHVLDPLCGYLALAQALYDKTPVDSSFAGAYNFGPRAESNKSVLELVRECLTHWDGKYIVQSDAHSPHEATLLNLSIEKASKYLHWQPRWDFSTSVYRTVNWYKLTHYGFPPLDCMNSDINQYCNDLDDVSN